MLQLAIFLSILAQFPLTDAINCLVIRPGYGLTSEACPATAIGCRIRIRGDLIEWYDWAKLYDRNQLVCVYPEEYPQLSGCQRKASGSVRCWCGSQDDCNNPEISKGLYQAFITNDKAKMSEIVTLLESGNMKEIGSISPVKTTSATTTHKNHRITVKNRSKLHHSVPTTTATRPQTTTTSKVYDLPNKESYSEPVMYDDEIVEEKPRPLPTEQALNFDGTFEETRKKLEKEMKEEDERLKEFLKDEEKELEMMDEEPIVQSKPFSVNAKKSKLSAVERRGRMDERRSNQAEEERLAEIEREEAAEKMKKLIEQGRQRQEERDEEDEDDKSDDEDEDEKKAEEDLEKAGFTSESYRSQTLGVTVLLSIFFSYFFSF